MNVFDCETFNDEKKNVVIYCISYSINDEIFSIYKETNDNNETMLIRFLDSILFKNNENRITFFIHNINFDGMIIMDSVFNLNLKFNWLIRDLNIYMIEIYYLETKITFKCSYKFMPIALKNIKIGNTEKTIFPYDFVSIKTLYYIGNYPEKKYFNPSISDIEYNYYKKKKKIFDLKKEAIMYCENDVKITLHMLKSLREILLEKKYLKIFEKSLSAPSLSYKIFFKFWNNFKIKKKILKEEDLYIRNSYYGGRCEVFGNPNEWEIVHYFDFSGMYEQCMRQKFPIGNGVFKTTNLNYKRIGFHCIKFKSSMEIPVLPIHSEDKKLIFPNGVLVGCYWYEEIILFEQAGGEVIEIFSSYEFDKEESIFVDFVDDFSNVKKKGGLWKTFGKLMINSLYGGFAMSDKNYESIVSFSEIESDKILEKTDVLEYVKKNNCCIFKVLKNKKSSKIFNKKEKKWSENMSLRNVIYSSIIASKARIKLYKAIQKITESGWKIYYCDTDSIAAGYTEKKINIEYGEVKWSEIWNDAVFIAPKFYAYKKDREETIRLKGVTNQQYSFEKIKEAFYSNKNHLKFIRQLNFNKKNFKIEQKYIDKIIFLNKYNKRIFSKNKKTTTPIKY